MKVSAKKYIIRAAFMVAAIGMKGQTIDTTISVDALTVPNSPAFNLLQVSPNQVDKPTTPIDFAFSIANSSDNFSQLPKNYAFEFLPFVIFDNKQKTLEKFTGKGPLNNIRQTFVLSGAFSTNDSADVTVPNYIRTRSAFGFKVSLFRGKVDTSFRIYKDSLSKVREQLGKLHALNQEARQKFEKSDPRVLRVDSIIALVVKRIVKLSNDTASPERDLDLEIAKSVLADYQARKADLLESFKDKLSREDEKIIAAAAQLKRKVENIKFRRVGFLTDIAGGLVVGYRNDDFQNSIVPQYAVWANLGYSFQKNVDLLGLARMNTRIDTVTSIFYDFGGRLNFRTADERLLVGGEAIARVLSDTTVYRYTFNVSYQINKNQALTFSVGKAFGGKRASVRGNLIATLNLVIAFGSNRKLQD